MKFDGPFVPGKRLSGIIVPTTVDPEIASAQKPFEGLPFEIAVERMEAERVFSFRWHPFAIERDADYSGEPMTLVTFTLEKVDEEVLLTVSESGFDLIPLERRVKAFTANEQGWGMVVKLVALYVAS